MRPCGGAGPLGLPAGDDAAADGVHGPGAAADDALARGASARQAAQGGAHHRRGAGVQERALLDGLIREAGERRNDAFEF